MYEDSKATWETVSFLSHRFCQIPYKGRTVTVPVRGFMAILSGWLQDGNGSWIRSVERTSAYRTQAYFHPLLYRAMTDWMLYCFETYDPLNRCGLRSLLLPDSEIEKLHFSDEGALRGCKTTVDSPRLIMSIRLINQLKSGKITQAEYQQRLLQQKASAGGAKKTQKPKKKRAPNSSPATGSNAVPRGPSTRASRIGNPSAAGPKSDLEKYIESLACPESDKSAVARVPTRNSKFSSTFQSVQTFPIMYDNAWTPTRDVGRFCLLVKPILGDAGGAGGAPAPPNNWKSCLADGNLSSWQAGGSWTSSNSYTPYSGGKDLRVDKFCPFFTSPDSFLSRYTSTGGMTLLAPLGVNPDVSEQNISTAYQIATLHGLTLLGAGNYLLTLILDGTTLTNAVVNAYLPPGVNLIPATLGTQYQLTLIGTGTAVDGTALTKVWALTLSSSLWIGYTVTGATITGSYQFLSQVYQQFNDNTQNGGAIDRIRPISMSVLVTCTVADLVNGGTITGKLLNKSQCTKEFFNDITNAETGQFQDWEALSDTGNLYQGKFTDGARVIWLPEDDSDTDFLTPDESLDHEYPCALICGQFSPGQASFPAGQIARAIVVTNYEFTTSYTCLAGEKISGNDIMMSEAFNIMNTMPTATMNDAHWGFVQRVLQRAKQGAVSIGKWAFANRETIMGVAKGIADLTV